jgi:hypothetical protein
LSHFGGYRRRRYRYSGSRPRAVARRAEVSRLYGGIDDDVRQLFFGLDSFRLTLVFNVYERRHGDGKRKYAEAAFAKWKSAKVQMSGEISERLIRIVPEFLTFDQKYELIEKLWNRLRQTTRLNVTISPHGDLNAAVQTVMDAINALGEHEIPDGIADRLEWLAQDDAVAAKALLAQIAEREGQIAVETLESELRQILALALKHQDKLVTATRTVTLPGIAVYINVSQTPPNTPRRRSMSDKERESDNSNPAPLARQDDVRPRGDLAPIENPSDLLDEALRRMSPKKQEEIIAKATDEALRIQVKQADARVDAARAEKAVDTVTRQADSLARTGAEFDLHREERLEHGTVNISVRNKSPSLGERLGKCFVATACYGDYSHPAVLVLRRFRDRCLRNNAAGRSFVAWYYRNAPMLADFIELRPSLRLTGRLLLWPIVVVAFGITWLGDLRIHGREDQIPR